MQILPDRPFPRCMGSMDRQHGSEMGIYPIESSDGIKIMSVNLLMEDEEAPVIWRGPVIAGTVKQFWTDVVWGDLDYLFVDMPPGTGDVPLTVFQSLPVDGIVVVTSPQELVQMIVKKAYNMAGMMNIPVLGVVENYSYLVCPDCGKEIKVFGESNIDEIELPAWELRSWENCRWIRLLRSWQTQGFLERQTIFIWTRP